MSSLTSSYCSTTSSMSTTDDMDEFDLDDDSICSSMFSVCSSSAGSLSYSNADRTRSASVCSTVTAESVARSLIRQISHKNNWPVDVNVQWLISEKDAPQQVCHFVITPILINQHLLLRVSGGYARNEECCQLRIFPQTHSLRLLQIFDVSYYKY